MEPTDLQIVQGIKRRDLKTYEYIVEKYSKQVYYLAYNILHISCSREDMEECAADVFLEVWMNIGRFDSSKGSFKTWLFMLTKYKALEYKRRLSKQKLVNIDDLRIEDGENIERCFIARQDQEKVIEIIKGFNEIDKELFIRRYFYGEKTDDLMASLNLTRPAIDNRLLRGRKLIKEVISYE